MEDSGIYVCEGMNQAGISKKEVELIIQGELKWLNELLALFLFWLCYWFWIKSFFFFLNKVLLKQIF